MRFDPLKCMFATNIVVFLYVDGIKRQTTKISFIYERKLLLTKFLDYLLSGVNYVNVICAPFSYESLFSSYVLALNELSYKKCARKTLMKLTQGWRRESASTEKCFHFRLLLLFCGEGGGGKAFAFLLVLHDSSAKIKIAFSKIT